jgi:acetyl esterase
MLESGFHAYLGSLPPAIPKPARSTIPPCQDYRRPISSRRNMIRCATKGSPVWQAGAGWRRCHCQRQHGVIHGYFQLAAISPAARQLIDQIAMMLRRL